MIVLSLFDGISCGRVALERAGIPVTCYMSAEIDKYAIKVSQSNWPDIIQLGDVIKVREMAEAGNFGRVDLLIGGSPCQGFSFAGKQLAFDDPRSALFFEYVKILNVLRRTNPNIKFLLENVKMKKQFLDVITEYLGVEPVFINSALVSAQNRQRYYWCNWSVSQPADRGLLLRDIVESGAVDREKSYCIDANYYKGGSLNNYLEKSRRQIVLSARRICNVNPSGNGMNGWVYGDDAKSPTLTTNKGEGNKIEITGGRVVGRKIDPETGRRSDYHPELTAEQRLETRADGKAGCITSVTKDSVVVIGKASDKFGHDIQKRIHSTDGKSPAVLSANTGGAIPPKISTIKTQSDSWIEGITYRKLTPIECERLQTLPDNYTAAVSNTQRYKQLGNGWTVDVIAHIFSEMPQ